MDVREHSAKHEKIVAALLEQNGITPGYGILPEEEKVKLLTDLVQSENSVRVPEIWKDSEALAYFRVFTMIKQVQTGIRKTQSRPASSACLVQSVTCSRSSSLCAYLV